MSSVRQVTLNLLRELRMTTVFGNPGSTELGFLQNWPQDLRYILGLQESIVVGMADGYAQATGTAAFVSLHSAAGVGHALGSIYTAHRNQTPLVIMAGQQARDLMPLRPFLGASAATEFPRPYVKWSCEPARAADVPLAIAQAHHIAMQKPCGPTFVSVPADDWFHEAEAISVRPKSRDFGPDPVMIEQLATAIEGSQRPALVMGAGVTRDCAVQVALLLAERMQAPVWCAAMSSRASFPEDHPLFAGFLPAAPEPLANLLSGHDLVLVVGAPAFTFHISGNLARARGATQIYQITDDPETAACALSATSILGSARLAIVSLLEQISQRPERRDRLRQAPARIAPADPIPAAYVMQTLHEIRSASSVVIEEVPSHKPLLHQYLPIPDQGFFSIASGGLGFGLAAAAGVALADPTRHVICVVGDGSAMYSIQALWSAASYALPITYVVLNNGGYGAMRSFSRLMGLEDPPGIDLPLLDFVALARGHGCTGVRVSRASDLVPALREALSSDLPAVVEVSVDRAIQPLYKPPLQAARRT